MCVSSSTEPHLVMQEQVRGSIGGLECDETDVAGLGSPVIPSKDKVGVAWWYKHRYEIISRSDSSVRPCLPDYDGLSHQHQVTDKTIYRRRGWSTGRLGCELGNNRRGNE